MTLSGTNISMTRGDTETLTIRCSVPFEDGDTVYMTARESVEAPVAFQKIVREFGDEGEAVIVIDHEDTRDLAFGDYVYDVQVTRAAGAVKTLIQPSKLKLTEEVTYGSVVADDADTDVRVLLLDEY